MSVTRRANLLKELEVKTAERVGSVGRPVDKGDARFPLKRETCLGSRSKESFGTADHRSLCMKSIQKINKYVVHRGRKGQS